MRPSNLIYSVDEKPPALVCVVNAAQQLTIITPFLVYPILVMRVVGADEQATASFVALSFLAIGIGTLLVSTRLRMRPRRRPSSRSAARR